MMGNPLRALIVEDNEDDVELLVLHLKRAGFDVLYQRVETPSAYEDALSRFPWDIILCDHSLPKFSSNQALAILKQPSFQHLDIPFIIISGTIGEEVAVESMKNGASDYFIKGALRRLAPAIERELREAHGRAEHLIRESQFQTVFTASLDAMVILNETGHFMEANPAACALFQKSQSALLRSPIQPFLFPDHPEAFESKWQEFLKLERVTGDLKLYLSQPSGQKLVKDLEYTSTASFLPGRHLCIFRDITFRKEAERQLEQRLEREGLLRKMVEISSQSFDVETVLNAAAREIGTFFSADRCIAGVYNLQGHHREVRMRGCFQTAESVPAMMQEMFPPELIETLTNYIHFEDINQVLHFPHAEEGFVGAVGQYILKKTGGDEAKKEAILLQLKELYIKQLQVKSFLKVPVFYRGIPYGAFTLHQCTYHREWQEDEIKLLQDLATQIGISLYQAGQYKQEQKLAARETLLRRIIQGVYSSLNLEDKMQVVTQELRTLLQADHVFICRNIEMDTETDWGFNLSSPPQDSIVYGLETACPYFMVDDHVFLDSMGAFSTLPVEFTAEASWLSNEAKSLFQEQGIQSGLCCPIVLDERCTAFLFILQTQANREWTKEERDMLTTVSQQVAIAIYQADLYQEECLAKEEAEIANRKKSQFLATMSHELRTPLNAIIGFTQMMENGMVGPLNEKQQRYLNNVNVSAQHLLGIVNDLLDVSRAETGNMILHPKTIHIRPFLEKLMHSMDEMANKKNVRQSMEIQSELTEMVADEERLKQIFSNLLNNAIKFNHFGGDVFIKIYRGPDSCRTHPSPLREQWLVTEISDTGIGIPPEKMEDLFTEFYQVDPSFSRTHDGTGLGLALTRQLVELHGGHIQARSEVGVGSTFIFTLPVNGPVSADVTPRLERVPAMK